MVERLSPLESHISLAGRNFIKKWESLRLTAYQDSGGLWTIGWGHTKSVYPRMVIDREQAEAFLDVDLLEPARAIRNLVEVPLSQNEYDALMSFIFNIGVHKFADSTLLEKLNHLEYAMAADQMLRWDWADGKRVEGLKNRRRDERLLFTGHGG